MADKVEKSVGIIVLTRIPEMGLVAILRERGWINPKKADYRESWPGGCQVTAHGKLQEDDDFYDALFREITEELGEDASGRIRDHANELVEVFRLQKENKNVVTYAIKLEPSFIEDIRLGPESGAIRLVRPEEANSIIDLFSLDKSTGVQYRRTIAMFPDEKQAVINAFARFS